MKEETLLPSHHFKSSLPLLVSLIVRPPKTSFTQEGCLPHLKTHVLINLLKVGK